MPFELWREEIAPLWAMQGAYRFIPPIMNGHGQIQYIGREMFSRMLMFPVAAEYEGERIAWTSAYNISDEAIRIRGIYVLPEYRSNGIGRAMVEYAMSLWPTSWRRCLLYARESNVGRYEKWGFEIVPDHKLRTFELEETFDEKGTVLMHKEIERLPVETQ